VTNITAYLVNVLFFYCDFVNICDLKRIFIYAAIN